jgi:GT2 family glycosyltransferase
MMAKSNRLTIAIVTYNARDHIADCVKPFADRPEDIRIRVLDNGSTDTTPKILKGLMAGGYIDDLILSDVDAGFAIAANEIITHSANDDVLLLNPDARVHLATIQAMRDSAQHDATIGAVSPVVTGGAELSVMSAGRQPRLWPMFTHYSGLSRIFPRSRILRGRHLFLQHHSNEDQFVEWTSGCCLYIPRSTIDRVGLLSERWFLYAEDTEYCKRVIDAGLKIKILSTARAFHAVGASVTPTTVEDDLPLADHPPVESSQQIAGPDNNPPVGIDTMWGRNLYDYYLKEFRPNVLTRLAWRVIFTSGNGARALARSFRDREDRTAKHLMKNALAIWH